MLVKSQLKLWWKHFESLDALVHAQEEVLVNIDDIGEITAQGIIAYFNLEENLKRIQVLKEVGVNMVAEVNSQASIS